ncbi:MAG TPA: putative ABC exporter domain-containing protein [Gemmatimonadaceae bacterium]|nr:putative ABC exporter domain-containing protein [Gemmatimonadaceae bacterium]
MSNAGALWYLLRRSFRNRLVRQRKRLRSPTAAIALLLGVAYLALLVGNPAGASVFPARPFAGAGTELAALMLLVFIGRWWLFGAERTALAFTPAEVHFLFPAPLSRRTIVAYRLARTQAVLLLNAAIWTWLFQGGGVPAPARLFAFWLLFGTLHMHMLGASLVRAGMLEHGRAGVRRHRGAVVILAAVVGAIVWSVASQAGAIEAADGALPTLRAIGIAMQSGPAHLALAPLRFILEPALASSLGEWGRALPLALAVTAAHLAWVVGADIAFEEAAVEASERLARRLEAWRQGRGLADAPRGVVRTPLALAPHGHPAVAILWKNAIAMIRGVRGAAVARLAVVALAIVTFSTLNSKRDFVEMIGIMLGTWSGLLVLAGPVWVRFDFRRDLARLDTLRVLPVSGTAIAAAEIAGSALAITGLQLAMLALAAAMVATGALNVSPPPSPVIALFIAAIVPLNMILVGVHNVYALSSPDAGRREASRAAGIEAFGVHLLVMLLSLLALILALALPALAGGVVRRLLMGGAPALASIAMGVVAIAVLAAEAWLVVLWVGRVFARGTR